MTANFNLTAVFSPVQLTLTVGVVGQGSTNITGTHSYAEFTNVTVLATPDPGWNLDHWELNGTVYGLASFVTVNMTANYDLVAVFKPPSSYLVVRGADDRIYYRGYNPISMSWESWNALPEGATVDSPAAAVYSGTLYIAIRGEDGQNLWFGSVNLTDNSFSGWTLLSGATPSAPTLASNGTTLTLVVRGEDNRIYYRFYDIASQTWIGWNILPSGWTPDSPAAVVSSNTLYISVRGFANNNQSIYFTSINLANQSFSGWTLLSGATPSAPTLTS
jgi:hypothetical protein